MYHVCIDLINCIVVYIYNAIAMLATVATVASILCRRGNNCTYMYMYLPLNSLTNLRHLQQQEGPITGTENIILTTQLQMVSYT